MPSRKSALARHCLRWTIAKTLSKWKVRTNISEGVETIDTPQTCEVIHSWILQKQTRKTVGSLRVNRRFLKDPRSSPYFTMLLQEAANVELSLSTTYEISTMGKSVGRLGIRFLVSRTGNTIQLRGSTELTVVPAGEGEHVAAPWALRAVFINALFPYTAVARQQLFHVDRSFLRRFWMATIDGTGEVIDRDGELQIEADEIGQWAFVAKFAKPFPSSAPELFTPRGMRHFLALMAVSELSQRRQITVQVLLQAMGMQLYSAKRGRSHGYRKQDVAYAKRFLEAMRSFRGFQGEGIVDNSPVRLSRRGAQYRIEKEKGARGEVRLPADIARTDHDKRRGLMMAGLIAASQEKPLQQECSWWLRLTRHEVKATHGIRPVQQLESDLIELVRQGMVAWECPEATPPLDSRNPRECKILVGRPRWVASREADTKNPKEKRGTRIPMNEVRLRLIKEFGSLSQAANTLGLTTAQFYKASNLDLIRDRLKLVHGFAKAPIREGDVRRPSILIKT